MGRRTPQVTTAMRHLAQGGRSKGVTNADRRRELLKNPTRRVVRSGNDFLPRERRDIVPEFRSQQQVREQTVFHSSSGSEHDLSDIVRRKTGDLRNRLRERRWTGDHVFLRARSSRQKGTPAMFARFEME